MQTITVYVSHTTSSLEVSCPGPLQWLHDISHKKSFTSSLFTCWLFILMFIVAMSQNGSSHSRHHIWFLSRKRKKKEEWCLCQESKRDKQQKQQNYSRHLFASHCLGFGQKFLSARNFSKTQSYPSIYPFLVLLAKKKVVNRFQTGNL